MLMPAKKDQAPPDLHYFEKAKNRRDFGLAFGQSYSTAWLSYPSPPSGRAGWGLFTGTAALGHPTRLARARHPPRSRLSDSHILEPQCCTVFDALEVVQPPAHHLGTGLTVVTGPSSQPGDHPSGKGERALRMRVLLGAVLPSS